MATHHPTYDELSTEAKAKMKLVDATMRKISSDEILQAVKRELHEVNLDFATYLEQYVEEHRGKTKIFAWYLDRKVCGIFCPEDHSGRWFMTIDKLSGVGQIREATLVVLESLAKNKGLI